MTEAHPHGREPEEPHGVTVPTPHHAVNYYAIFATLVVLTAVTVGAAFLDIRNEGIRVAVALAIDVRSRASLAPLPNHLPGVPGRGSNRCLLPSSRSTASPIATASGLRCTS